MNADRLLYLGFAFPPGVAGHFPEAQPAGHLIETCLVNAVRPWFDIRSVGISWLDVQNVPPGDSSPGLPHALNLLDRWPEVYHRWNSLLRLQRAYAGWERSGWSPGVIMMYNFSPVYNGFVRRLKRRPNAPKIVLLLEDSMSLQRALPWARRLRYRLKPLTWTDAQMVRYVDACVAVSLATEQFFAARKIPWLWLPNGCEPKRAVQSSAGPGEGPLRFGYFGALAPHTGLPDLLRVFTARARQAELHICGYGETKEAVAEACRRHPYLRLYPPRTPDECLQFAQHCDVMVNPRPNVPGNENNFPSKAFEYALAGRAILSTALSGVERILGERAFYFDAHDFERSLDEALERLCTVPRAELNRRGQEVQQRLLANFTWAQQGERLARFLQQVLNRGNQAPALQAKTLQSPA
jgi:glycosyltransferase involved in cell wall biosynthesis